MTDAVRTRRPPPPFLRMEVREITMRTPYLARVTFGGEELGGLEVAQPAASVRLLIPSEGVDELVIPEWQGNEFLLPDGSRPIIRTFTPVRADPAGGRLDLDVVLHDGGAISAWVEAAGPGAPAAVSGPSRGYTVDRGASHYLLAGDETAIPAIEQLVAEIPQEIAVQVIVEVRAVEAAIRFIDRPRLQADWVPAMDGEPPGAALVAAVETADLPPATKVWCAGEAAAMHRIRKHLFDERGVARSDVTVRGYWKHGR